VVPQYSGAGSEWRCHQRDTHPQTEQLPGCSYQVRRPNVDTEPCGVCPPQRPASILIALGSLTFQKVPNPRRGTFNCQTYTTGETLWHWVLPRLMYSDARSVLALSKLQLDPSVSSFFTFRQMSLIRRLLRVFPPHYQTLIFRMVARPTLVERRYDGVMDE
jgi:hypothetical protein